MNTEETNVARTRTTHKQSRERNARFAEMAQERNARFAEMAQEPEIKKYLDNMPKSTHISYLRNIYQQKYGFNVPPSAAYKIMASIDDRFKPKHRRTDTNADNTQTASEV